MRLLYTLSLLCLLPYNHLSAQAFPTEKIAIKLLENMAASPNEQHSVHILLQDEVDLSAMDAELSAQKATASHRSETVICALRNKAKETQRGLLFFLKNSKEVEKTSIRSFWIANAIAASVKKEAIEQLSKMHEVKWIGLSGQLKMDASPPAPEGELLPASFTPKSGLWLAGGYSPLGAGGAGSLLVPNGTEPGLSAINAPAMWAMGYTGYGQLAFISDTGVDPSHPALAASYRGHHVPKEQTWFEIDSVYLEPTGNYYPFDCSDHGTHVCGTVLGLERMANDTVGVAFNAQWIGAPVLCGIGTDDNVAAFQWALDPDGDPSTADDIPDVINNSWHDPNLDVMDCFSIYVPVLEALEVIGVAVVFSAGNDGPGEMSITQPKNINLSEVNTFSVAALNANTNSLPIANFSSIGPSQCGGENSILIKPEVAAPGVSVRSCEPGGGYGFKSGTSMAAPHVCGAILLLKEAFPDLTGRELKLALYRTCTDLGVPGEDNVFGMGIINVLEAFNYLIGQGNEPVSPHRSNDVMLVKVRVADFSCDNKTQPLITIENAGTDSLFSCSVFYEVDNVGAIYEWTGALATAERAVILLPQIVVEAGKKELLVDVSLPNGEEDERPLNDRFTLPIKVAERNFLQIEVDGFASSVCEGGSVLLRGILPSSLANSSGRMDVRWYDEAFGGSLLGQGEVFATPSIFAPTTFYAEASYSSHAGPRDATFGEVDNTSAADKGLLFEVFYEMDLEAIHVITEETGGLVLQLVNLENGETKQDVTVISETGKLRIDLDWKLSPGNYELAVLNEKSLTYNTSGAAYPYLVNDILSIDGTSDGQGENGVYYFFYDWEISYGEPCGRTAILVDVMPAGEFPEADFIVSADTVFVVDNEAVEFADNSSGAVEWFWNFGDGIVSNEQNPSHVYSAAGEYIVSLTVAGEGGCTGSAIETIFVSGATVTAVRQQQVFENIAVYPNPVKERLSVFFDLPFSKKIDLQLVGTNGQVWKTTEYRAKEKGELQLAMDDVPAGIYFLMIKMEEGSAVWKVVKL